MLIGRGSPLQSLLPLTYSLWHALRGYCDTSTPSQMISLPSCSILLQCCILYGSGPISDGCLCSSISAIWERYVSPHSVIVRILACHLCIVPYGPCTPLGECPCVREHSAGGILVHGLLPTTVPAQPTSQMSFCNPE